MKNTTVKNYSSSKSSIQSIIEGDIVAGLKKYTAVCILRYKGVYEYKVSTWHVSKEDAIKKLNKMRVQQAFNIIKYSS